MAEPIYENNYESLPVGSKGFCENDRNYLIVVERPTLAQWNNVHGRSRNTSEDKFNSFNSYTGIFVVWAGSDIPYWFLDDYGGVNDYRWEIAGPPIYTCHDCKAEFTGDIHYLCEKCRILQLI